MLAFSNFNKSSIKTLERRETWFNQLRIQLAETDVDVDILALSGQKFETLKDTPDIARVSIQGETSQQTSQHRETPHHKDFISSHFYIKFGPKHGQNMPQNQKDQHLLPLSNRHPEKPPENTED